MSPSVQPAHTNPTSIIVEMIDELFLSLDRGLCFFQAVLIGDDTRTARASLNQIRQAADKLILDCAAGEVSQGGIALNIGPSLSSCPLISRKPLSSKHDRGANTVKVILTPFFVPGGDNMLAVALGTYEPTVQCRGAFGPEWTSCRDILGDMPAYKTEMVFGPRGAPGVQQPLPLRIESCKTPLFLSLCLLLGYFPAIGG